MPAHMSPTGIGLGAHVQVPHVKLLLLGQVFQQLHPVAAVTAATAAGVEVLQRLQGPRAARGCQTQWETLLLQNFPVIMLPILLQIQARNRFAHE